MPEAKQISVSWDDRPFRLTLAGCLVIAGLPLAAEAVAEVKSQTREQEIAALQEEAELLCEECNTFDAPRMREINARLYELGSYNPTDITR